MLSGVDDLCALQGTSTPQAKRKREDVSEEADSDIGEGCAYWKRRYERVGGCQDFEWLPHTTPAARTLFAQWLRKHDGGVTPDSEVLVIGCGTSKQPLELAGDLGCKIIATDCSGAVINAMAARHRHASVRWEVADCMELLYASNRFAAVVDKGTLDAVQLRDEVRATNKYQSCSLTLGHVSVQGARTAKLLAEAARVLKPGGVLLLASLHGDCLSPEATRTEMEEYGVPEVEWPPWPSKWDEVEQALEMFEPVHMEEVQCEKSGELLYAYRLNKKGKAARTRKQYHAYRGGGATTRRR